MASPLVVISAGLVDIGAGELVWTRVYTASSASTPPPQPSSSPPPQQRPTKPTRSDRRSSTTSSNAALATLVADRRVILALHGFPDTGELWDELARDLARRAGGAVAVVAPDLPGAGLSDAALGAGATCPEDVPAYGVGSLARRMLALLSALGVRRAAGVVGHDFGAAVAWRMALAAPPRVERLCVLSVGHPAAAAAGGARQRARFWYYLFLSLSEPDEAEAALKADGFALLRQVIEPAPAPGAEAGRRRGTTTTGGKDGGDASTASRSAVDAYVARFSRSPKLLRAATNLYRANYRAASFGATRVASPAPGLTIGGGGSSGGNSGGGVRAVMGIIGARDPALTVEQMRASAAFVVPPATWACEVWPEAGHWLTRDDPARLAAALAGFFFGSEEEGEGARGAGGAGASRTRARL